MHTTQRYIPRLASAYSIEEMAGLDLSAFSGSIGAPGLSFGRVRLLSRPYLCKGGSGSLSAESRTLFVVLS
jgi:hypothetical protein